MGNFIDMVGRRFGALTVIRKADPAPGGEARWECRCDCGNTVLAKGSHLRSGNYTSCGCIRKKKTHSTLYSLPRQCIKKYGCTLCTSRTQCAKFYLENGYLTCKYAFILDSYSNYRAYEKAIKGKCGKILRRIFFNENNT